MKMYRNTVISYKGTCIAKISKRYNKSAQTSRGPSIILQLTITAQAEGETRPTTGTRQKLFSQLTAYVILF